MSYLDSLYLDSFQTTERHSYDGYSVGIAIFSSFFQGVYPVGMIEIQCYFMRIIGHNSMILYWILTKLGTEIKTHGSESRGQ